MLRLQLRRERRTEDQSTHRLVFPRRALDQATRVRPSIPQAPRPSADVGLISSIHDTLDRMQRQLHVLNEDVQHYRFPTLDEGPPSTAA